MYFSVCIINGIRVARMFQSYIFALGHAVNMADSIASHVYVENSEGTIVTNIK